jgi:hypothetical protein
MIRRPDVTNAYATIAAEFLFVLMPLFVVTLVMLHKGSPPSDILATPEWSVASSILGGMALVRMVTGVSRVRRGASPERVALAVALVMVFAVAPALVILAVVISSPGPPAGWVVSAQVLQFLVCSAIFFLFGTTGQLWLSAARRDDDELEVISPDERRKRAELENAVVGALDASRLNPRPRGSEHSDE